MIEDRGEALILRPLPADPIGAAIDSFAGPGPTADEMRAALRREEAELKPPTSQPARGDRALRSVERPRCPGRHRADQIVVKLFAGPRRSSKG